MPTLQKAVETFLKVDRSVHTNRNYHHQLARMVAALGAAREVNRVSHEDIFDFVSDMRQNGGLSQATLFNYMITYKAFFNWCIRRGYCKRSPAAGVQVRKPSRPPEERGFPPADMRALRDAVRQNSPKLATRNLAILYFFAGTAARIGGIASLTLDHLYLDRGGAWILEKGSRWVDVYFSSDVGDALRDWIAIRPAVEHKFVFTTTGKRGNPLSAAAIQDFIRAAADRAGIRVRGPHALRHAVGEAWARRGVPPDVVQAKLNHVKLETTLENYYPRGSSRVQEYSHRLGLAVFDDPPLLGLPPDSPAPAGKILVFPKSG